MLVPLLLALKMSVHVMSDINTGIMSQAMIQIKALMDETFFAMWQLFHSCCHHQGGRVLMYAWKDDISLHIFILNVQTDSEGVYSTICGQAHPSY